jgi:hypothetical protein
LTNYQIQPKRYLVDQTRVGLVGTLLTGQVLSWYVPMFEKGAPILNNFEAFLAAFAKAFKDHDKARLATTKICGLWQRSRLASIYASSFKLLVCVELQTIGMHRTQTIGMQY